MDIAAALVFRSVRTLKSFDPATLRTVMLLAIAVITVSVVVVTLQTTAPESIIVAPLRWSS